MQGFGIRIVAADQQRGHVIHTHLRHGFQQPAPKLASYAHNTRSASSRRCNTPVTRAALCTELWKRVGEICRLPKPGLADFVAVLAIAAG